MTKVVSLLALLFLFFSKTLFASSAAIPLAEIDIVQDQNSIKRGAMIYYNVCRLCHSMKYIKYQNLQEIGFSEVEIDKLRGEHLINQAMKGLMSDEASLEYYGMVPPDLSVMAKARKHGPQYIYTLLTSFSEKDGSYTNKLFPGTKMPDVLNYSIAIDSSAKQAIEAQAKDVTEFLTWSADPRAAERKSLGKYVIAYLIILSIMFYLVMKRVWSRLDK